MIFLAGALVGIALAIIKPWDLGRPPVADTSVPAAPPAVTSTVGPGPSAQQTPSVALATRSWQCYYASDWRVFALGVPADQLAELDRIDAGGSPSARPASASPEPPAAPPGDPSAPRTFVTPIRTWIQVEPLAGPTDPLDPRIPFVRIVVGAIPALGYCAPTSDPDRPPTNARMAAWSLTPGGTTAEVGLRRIAGPSAPGDSTEGLYVPEPSAGTSGTEWVAGRYVFALRDQTPGGYARWFGVEVLDPPGPLQSVTP